VDQFNSESVLFRESERLDLGLWLRRLVRDRRPTPTASAALCCGVWILMVSFFASSRLSMPEGLGGFALTVLVTQVIVIAAPALLMALVLTSSPRQTLLLRWPAWWTVPAAGLLALALHPSAHVLQSAVERLYPVSEEFRQALEGINRLFGQANFWTLVLLIAVVPAVCEELAFRGFILSGFRHLGHRWRAIVLSALLFGLTHGILQQSLSASLVGVLIGYLAVQSGSILPGMAFHLIHNTLVLAGSRVTPEMFPQSPLLRSLLAPDQGGGCLFPWQAVVAGAGIGLLLLMCFSRLPCPKSAEESLEEAIDRGQPDASPLVVKPRPVVAE
jgi:sodium transport system permease protein